METTTKLRELFERVVALPAAARAAFLSEHCPDPAQRAELERMLAADATGGDLLDAGDAAAAAERIGDAQLEPSLPPGSRIGPFELIEVLGEGGSSTVFRAFREVDGVRQEVALKLLRHGLYAPDAQRQFRREQRALAQLKHPGIARLIEGGITESGLAYIALELVDGISITRYASEQGIGLDARLALFERVCNAVQAAHRALIVHRDLKPSNVLVTSDGEVKLLDFGIAKLLEDEEQTQTFHAAFTPAYAAPEQHAGEPATTATDVFALGVLLGELVTGQRLNDGRGTTPSARFRVAGAPPPPHIDRRQLKGDLDNIVMKAIDTEPDRRYASAGALADDIARMRGGQPVMAHPPSRAYRMRKFVSRHRGGVAVTALLLLAIFAALGAALWQANVARQEARRANAIRDFIVDILEKTAPDGPAATRPDVPTLVYTAASELPEALRDQPLVRTELLYTLGNVLRNMQDVQHSEALLRDAEKTAASLPDNDPVRLETEVGLIRTLIRRGDYDGASARITPLLAIPPRRLPEDAPRAMLLKIAMVIADGRADMQQAVAHGRKMIAAYRADCVAGKHCRDLAFAANDFASILLDADHIAEARPIADEALERKQHENVSLLSLANTVELQSKIALYRGDFAIAEAKARKSDALVASLGNSLAHKPLEPVAQLVEVLLAKGDAASAKNTLDGLMAEQRARKASACTLAWSEMDLSRAQLLLGLPGDAADSGAKAVADGGQCRRAIVRDVTVVLAELAHARALAALGDIDAAAADYARTTAMDATLHHDDPLSWPLYLVQSMRLAETLGRGDDAARFAHALTGALDRADALPTHPWRIEAARVADGAHKVPTGT